MQCAYIGSFKDLAHHHGNHRMRRHLQVMGERCDAVPASQVEAKGVEALQIPHLGGLSLSGSAFDDWVFAWYGIGFNCGGKRTGEDGRVTAVAGLHTGICTIFYA